MTVTTFNFAPGINKDDSPLASEGGWIDADKVRFVSGRPQTIGGWDKVTFDTFDRIARGAHAWAGLSGFRYIAFGTAEKLYVVAGGALRDITPAHSEGVLINPFTTTSASDVVLVTHVSHGFSTGTEVTFLHQAALVGGLFVSGTYQVSVIDDDSYTIAAGAAASSSATGGGYVDYTAVLPAGLVSGVGEPGGYGAGAYGSGGYGTFAVIDSLPRVWFLSNWGETLVALPRGGALYQWQPALSYPELISNGSFASAAGWTLGAGWSVSGGFAVGAAGAASNLMPTAALDIVPGYVYRVGFTLSPTAGTVALTTDAGSIGEASSPISVPGTYSRRFRAPAGATRIVFSKDAAFVGSVGNVSVTLEPSAYRIDEAPRKNAAMFVEPRQFVVMLGTSPYGEPYNSMAVRWCDRQNLTEWTPASSNLAGDNILAQGSRLVAGLATRQESLIWSDAGLFSMQYTGDQATTFMFNLLGSGCGLIGALACAEHGGAVYWSSHNDFYRYVGAAPEPIPSTLRRHTFDNLADKQGEKIVCGALPAYGEVWFFYPDARDGNECSRYVAIGQGGWTAGTFGRSSWVKPGVFEHPIALGTDGSVYFHEIGASAAGGAISWFIESAYFDIGDGENLAFLRRIIGDFDDLTGPANFTVYGRPWPTAPEQTFGPYMHTADTRKIDLRVMARQLKIRIDGTSAPAFARLGALRLDIVQSGAKR